VQFVQVGQEHHARPLAHADGLLVRVIEFGAGGVIGLT
jgi:hypothetical protein